jgi:DNA repair exonuclease SbcCD ATPase subunit
MRSLSLLLAVVLCSLPSQHEAASLAPALCVRGGGWFSFGVGKVEDRYRQSLEDQIQILERQARAAREETTQLRKLAKLAGRSSGDAASSIRQELVMLQKQVLQLETFKQEMEVLLKEEQDRSDELENKLIDSGSSELQLHNEHLIAMEQLEKTLLIKAKKQIEELNTLMDLRVKESADRARQEALKEMDKKITEAVSKVEIKLKMELEEERKKASDAVEKERAKMRKLVKALAEREKKATPTGKATVSATSRKQNTTPTSVRSPIKNT